jgi:hypothetical protein
MCVVSVFALGRCDVSAARDARTTCARRRRPVSATRGRHQVRNRVRARASSFNVRYAAIVGDTYIGTLRLLDGATAYPISVAASPVSTSAANAKAARLARAPPPVAVAFAPAVTADVASAASAVSTPATTTTSGAASAQAATGTAAPDVTPPALGSAKASADEQSKFDDALRAAAVAYLSKVRVRRARARY